jgi:hypothetical protein
MANHIAKVDIVKLACSQRLEGGRMGRTSILALVLLLSAACLQAQDAPPAGNPSDHPTSAHASTVQGCLQGSNGSFTVTDKSGSTYEIQGDTSTLSKHLGHEVQITGTTSTTSSEKGESAGGTSSATEQQIIHLQDVKHVSKTCKSGKTAKD